MSRASPVSTTGWKSALTEPARNQQRHAIRRGAALSHEAGSFKRACFASASARAVDDSAFRQVVRRELDGDGVTFQDADVVFPHLARDVRGHNVAVLELDAKGRVR